MIDGDIEPRRFDIRDALDIRQHRGRIEVWHNATERRPASERRVLHILN